MTHFDRALTKAFTRRESAQPTMESPSPDTTRGWVSRVRAPAGRPTEADDAPTPFPAQPDTTSISSPSPSVDDNSPEPSAVAANSQIIESAIARSANLTTLAGSSTAWHWPSITSRLLESSAGADLRRLAIFLESLPHERKTQSIAFCGPGRAAGRTSLLMTVARILADDAELRLLLLDADGDHAGLSAELGVRLSTVEPRASSIAGRRNPLPDIARWTGGSGTTEKDAAETVNTVLPAGWRRDFDLLLIDAGTWKSLHTSGLVQAGVVDAVVSVRRYDAFDDDETARRLCCELGVRLLGVVETFVPAKFGNGSQAA